MVCVWDGEVGGWARGAGVREYGEFGVDVGAVGGLSWVVGRGRMMGGGEGEGCWDGVDL